MSEPYRLESGKHYKISYKEHTENYGRPSMYVTNIRGKVGDIYCGRDWWITNHTNIDFSKESYDMEEITEEEVERWKTLTFI